MYKHILFSLVIGVLLNCEAKAQTKRQNYIVNLQNDTIDIKAHKWTDKKVVSIVNGKRTVYRAKNVQCCNVNGRTEMSGRVCPVLLGFKSWFFLAPRVEGKMSLYSMTVRQKDIHSSTGGSFWSDVLFVRKDNWPRGEYKKILTYTAVKKASADCPEFIKRLPHLEYLASWENLVHCYNQGCSSTTSPSQPITPGYSHFNMESHNTLAGSIRLKDPYYNRIDLTMFSEDELKVILKRLEPVKN